MNAMIDAQQCIDAEALLYRTLAAIDATSGQVRSERVETAAYREFCERRAAFTASRAAYTAAYKQSQTSVNGRRGWPLVSVSLQAAVDAALLRMRSAGSAEFERAEALLERAAIQRRQGHA